ncbi:MAG: glycosyltransferase [Candidatus Eremiobacteraeota bacterium]|nr:glycosyltransferase [Candidatus Eremiobacteraeota bacterium]
MALAEPRCSLVIATRNRREALLRSLAHLMEEDPSVPIIVVDNGSNDGTSEQVRRSFTGVHVVTLPSNRGAAARNVGARMASTPYVAFNDDDTYWSAGSLERACTLLDRHARVAALCANVRVLPGAAVDRACRLMAESALEKRTACPGTAIASFLAGATVVRREAFLAAGGFHPRFFIGAEEALLSIDLMSAGWELVYDDELLVYHTPCNVERDHALRKRLVARNRLWTAWLRNSLPAALGYSLRVAARALKDPDLRRALSEALRGLGWILRERRPMPRVIERRYAVISEV